MSSLTLTATSRADDAAYRALADISRLTAALEADYRVVGGQMTSLLVFAYGATQAPDRATADADLGTEREVIANPELITMLSELGYDERPSSNTFIRRIDDDSEAAIDILGPSGTTRLESATGGDITYDAIPGLSLALARPAVVLDVTAILTDGSELTTTLLLPDPVSALVLKTLAWNSRSAGKDALDIWRLLEVCLVGGITPDDFTFGAKRDAARVLRKHFAGPGGFGVKTLGAQGTNRVTGLVARLIGRENP